MHVPNSFGQRGIFFGKNKIPDRSEFMTEVGAGFDPDIQSESNTSALYKLRSDISTAIKSLS